MGRMLALAAALAALQVAGCNSFLGADEPIPVGGEEEDAQDPPLDAGPGAGSCGDGVVQPGEACDDGNTDPDDGCADCAVVCAPPDVLDTLSGHCYRLSGSTASGIDVRTWDDASAKCEAWHGTLATVTSLDELVFVQPLVDHVGTDTWIGGLRDSGVFTWATGEPWDYDAWAPGAPSDQEHCVRLGFESARFETADCAAHLPYLCERPVASGSSPSR